MKIDCEKFLAKLTRTIQEHNDDALKQAKILFELGYITKELYELLKKAIINHDIGKCNLYFAKRITTGSKFDDSVEVPHNIISIFLMDPNDFNDEKEFYLIAHAVLGHHNYTKNYTYIGERTNKEKIKNLIKPFGCTCKNINEEIIEKIKDLQYSKEANLLTGFLCKCDWAASASIENPEAVVEIKNDYLLDSLENWKNTQKIEFRPLQLYAKENSNENCITIAQTGMGKTEAALLWIGDNKGFFFLPLKVSNNAIYERCKALIKDDNFCYKLGLLHSDMPSYYNNDKEDIETLKHIDLTRSLSLPLTISTVDQLFDFVYKYPGYERKLSTLSYSKIVIDEIQSYDPKVMAAIVYGIKEIISVGGKVHILTATLAPYIKDLLLSPDDKGNVIDFKFNKFIDDSIKRHNLKVIDNKLSAADVIDGYKQHKGKTLVICNTVKKAQEIYEELMNSGIENVNLLHSKFTMGDRRKKESDILDCGKTQNNENVIWVTTQIVEASLDIDFDYLYTEMSDLSSLFQRFGRVNRKGEKPVDNYNCFVYLKINKYLIGKLVDEALYKLSCEAIKNIDGLLLESKKDELIEEYLTTQKLNEKKSNFLREYRKEYKKFTELFPSEYEKAAAKLRDIVNLTFIPNIVYENNKKTIEEYLDIINSKTSYEEKLKAKDKIKDFTASIPGYDKKKLSKSIRSIKLSKYEFIEVYDCEYSFEKGIVFTK